MDEIWPFVFPTVKVVLLGYLIGSIPSGVFWSRVFKDKSGIKRDVRQRGSKSTGATNIGRSHGLWAFLLVMFLDGLKGLISVFGAAILFHQDFLLWVAGFSAVAGHFKSSWLFVLDKWFWKIKGLVKGGKGMSTTAGVLVALTAYNQLPIVVFGILFICWLLILGIFRYMSVASISAAVLFPILMRWPYDQSWIKLIVSVVLSGALISAHVPNIRRLWKGIEPKFTLTKMTQENLPTVGFAIQPIEMGIVRRYFEKKVEHRGRIIRGIVNIASDNLIKKGLRIKRNFFYSDVIVQSKIGKRARIKLYVVPWTPEQLIRKPRVGLRKVVAVCQLAAQGGCKLVGLGAYTAIVGSGGQEVANRFGDNLAITTGNTLTVVAAIKATLKAVKLMGKIPEELTLVVVGKDGSIGKVIISTMSPIFQTVIPIGRDDDIRLVKKGDVVISASSTETAIINPEDLKIGAIVCDVARPRDVAAEVRKDRKDVLVIDGGMIRIPGTVIFPSLTGLEPSLIWGCLGETVLLALEERWENYSLGKELELKKVLEMENLAEKHGFVVDTLRSFEKPITIKEINRIKVNIELTKATKSLS